MCHAPEGARAGPASPIASAVDSSPTCAVAAYFAAIRTYHDHPGPGTRARQHSYRHSGGPNRPHNARGRAQITQFGHAAEAVG